MNILIVGIIILTNKTFTKLAISVNIRNKLFIPEVIHGDFSDEVFSPSGTKLNENVESLVTTSPDDNLPLRFTSKEKHELVTDSSSSDNTVQLFKRHQFTFSPIVSSRITSTADKVINKFSHVITDKNNSLQVTGMKCFISANEGIYYATLFGDIHSVPVVEDSILSDECKVLCTNSNKCSLDFQSKDISKCGVHRCGTDTKILLCVTVRIPTVTKLVLPEDITILLQCHPQTTIISQTKQIRISPKEVTGRMANIGSRIVATGGSKARFNSQITLFRHGSSGFTRKVTSGDFIILGEELLLQSSINSGDGWKYSRLSNITVQRVINNKGKKSVVDSISLVDLNGCRNPNMINISPWHPIVDPQNDLIVTFLFRVFMFDGMKEGDELIISVQLVACILKHHCYLRTDLCDHNDFKGVSRRKRAADSNTAGWKEDLTFKIIFSKNGHEELLKGSHYRSWIFVSVIASGIFILLISFLIFLVLKFLLHNGSN